jgi:hypothetical protein
MLIFRQSVADLFVLPVIDMKRSGSASADKLWYMRIYGRNIIASQYNTPCGHSRPAILILIMCMALTALVGTDELMSQSAATAQPASDYPGAVQSRAGNSTGFMAHYAEFYLRGHLS